MRYLPEEIDRLVLFLVLLPTVPDQVDRPVLVVDVLQGQRWKEMFRYRQITSRGLTEAGVANIVTQQSSCFAVIRTKLARPRCS